MISRKTFKRLLVGLGVFSMFCLLAGYALAQDSSERIKNFVPDEIYCCPTNKYIIIELPAGDYTAKLSSPDFSAEMIENYVWVQALKLNAVEKLYIRNSEGQGVIVNLNSTGECENPIKIIVDKLTPMDPAIFEAPAKPAPEESKKPEQPVDDDSMVKKIETQSIFSLNGGFFSLPKNSFFQMSGDALIAARIPNSGLFVQAAGMVALNGFMDRYGQSVGIGIDQGHMGIFLFTDLLQTRIKENKSDLSFHMQIRPTFRIRTESLFLTAFVAAPVISEDYTGVDDPEDPEIGIFNKAILHFGFDWTSKIKNRLIVNVSALVGSPAVFKIAGGLQYNLGNNFLLSGELKYYNFGNQPLLIESGYGSVLELNIGLSYGLGKNNFFTQFAKRLFIKPDYPLVIQVKKTKTNDTPSKPKGLYITLAADPVRGYAPLAVSFTEEFGGGTEPYTVEFQPVWKFSPITSLITRGYVYTVPGTYIAKAFIKDKLGNHAESNEVTIVVLASDKTLWNVIVTAGTGGTVTPGSSQVADGADSPMFNIQAGTGYVIDYVMIDGVNKGALTQYQFKNVKMNHNLEAFFRTGDTPPTNKYTIDASAGTGLSINPAGSRQYNAGSSADYTVSVIDANYEIYRVMVDGATVATNPANPYTYRFSNIQANHTINATSRLKTFTITATAGPNGTIAPSGAVVVNIGSSQGFTVTANSGYDIDVVTVDGGNVATSPASPYPYTFSNVQANHTINATFKQKLPVVFVDFHGPGHTDPGYGNYEKLFGSSMTINCIPNAGAEGDYIEVDGYRQAYQSSWTFSNIQTNHSFVAYFKSAPPPTYLVWEYIRVYNTKSQTTDELPPSSTPKTAGQWFTKTYYKVLNGRPYTVLQWVDVDGTRIFPDGNGNVTVNFQVNRNSTIYIEYNDTIN